MWTTRTLRQVFQVLARQVYCHCLLFWLPVIQGTEAIAVTTPGGQTGDRADQDDDDNSDIIKGLAAGFGFFFGVILLVCLVWCLCCANVCTKSDGPPQKRLRGKVSPSPPQSANVRTRTSAATSSSP